MHGSLTDVRQILRGFRREPGFAAIAVLALAIGVSSSTAMFSVIDAALLRPLPYLAPERLIQLSSVDGAGQRAPMGAVEFFQLQKNAKTVEEIGVLHASTDIVASPSGVRALRTANVSASMFATLGIVPVLGRPFEPAEDLAGPEAVAIASDAFFRRELGGDAAALGRVLEVDRTPVMVVGVLAPGAVFPRAENAELLFPLGITAEQAANPTGRNGLYGFARLKPGIRIAVAHAEIESIVHATSGYGVLAESLQRSLTGEAAPALRAAFAAVLLLLVIACANVSLLLLMRGTVRGRDLAIRAALGGGRRRVVFQQVIEGVALAVAGGAVGLVLAVFAVRGLVALAPEGIPRLHEVHVDWRMAAFALVASLISGALAGGVSAWQSLHSNLFLLLKDGGAGATPGRTKSRVRDGLVVAQLALALLLATGAGLLLRSLERLAAVPVGLDPRNLLASFVYPQGIDSTPATVQLLAAARAIPGVENAALVGYLPLDRSRWSYDDSVHVEGRSPSPTARDVTAVNWFGPGYLGTAGIRLLKGRDFGSADVADSAPVAIVNETFVARYLSGHEPIGALFTFVRLWKGMSFHIVGVIQDQRQWGPAYTALPEVYLPRGQFERNEQARGDGAMLVVKSSLPSGRVEAALRAAATALSAELSLGATRLVEDYLASYFQQRRFQLELAIAFALAALGLAAAGVYGAMAFSVVQRRRELAVRAALGAQWRQLSGLVLVRGARLALLGICFGVAGSLVLSRFLASLLYGVGERDPLTFAVVVVTLGLVALAASLLPALSAARLDPMTVLRRE